MTKYRAKTRRSKWSAPIRPDTPNVTIDDKIIELWNNGRDGKRLTGREIHKVLVNEFGIPQTAEAFFVRLSFLMGKGLLMRRGSGSYQLENAGTGLLKKAYRERKLQGRVGTRKKCLGGCGRIIVATSRTRLCEYCNERISSLNRFANI